MQKHWKNMCPHKHHLPKLFNSELVYLAVKLVFATYFRYELRSEPLEYENNIRLKFFCLSDTQHIYLRLCVEFICIFSNTLSINTCFAFKLCLHCRQRRTWPAPSCVRRRRKHRAKHLTFMAFVDANCFLTASVASSWNSYYTESYCLLMLQNIFWCNLRCHMSIEVKLTVYSRNIPKLNIVITCSQHSNCCTYCSS